MRIIRQNKAAQSVRQKLLNLAKGRGDDFQMVLARYALERLLARLERSGHREDFVLKGAMLFQIWSGGRHRATRDIDFLGFGARDEVALKVVFREICSIGISEDGLVFDPGSVSSGKIKAGREREGVRIQMLCFLERTRIPVRIDVGFGDVVTPGVQRRRIPTLLGFSDPEIRTYPPETVVAEKFHALVDLGMTNSRLKDFYDLHFLIGKFDFDEEVLRDALDATFERRGTELPEQVPVALTGEFSGDIEKRKQWSAFLKRSNIKDEISLDQVTGILEEFFKSLLMMDRDRS